MLGSAKFNILKRAKPTEPPKKRFYSLSHAQNPKYSKPLLKIHHISTNTISYKRTHMLKTQFFVFT